MGGFFQVCKKSIAYKVRWNNLYLLFIIGLVLVLPMHKANGQRIPLDKLQYNTLTASDGIVNNNLVGFFKDKSGYLWLGGHTLDRYDGHNIKSYFSKEDGMIYGKMIADGNGDLFIHTYFHGMLKYDAIQDTFLVFQDSILINGKMVAMRGDFAKASNGDIWYVGSTFIAILKKGSHQFVDITGKLGLPHDTYYNIIDIDANDNWWFSTPMQGLTRINTRTWKVTNRHNNDGSEPIFDQLSGLAHVKGDKKNNLWIQKVNPPHPDRTLVRYNLKSKTWHTYTFPYKTSINLEFTSTWVHNYFLDKKDVLWVRLGENVGIARYVQEEDRFEILYTEPNSKRTISGRFNVGAPSPILFEDRSGQFWTSSNYITYFDPYRQNIFNISNEDLIKQLFGSKSNKYDILTSATLRNIVQAYDGAYYVSHSGLGIVRLDNNLKNPSQIYSYKNKATYPSMLFSVDGKTYYFADENSHILAFKAGQHSVKKVIDGAAYQHKYIRSTYVENDTAIWLGHVGNGLSRFNPVKNKIYFYDPVFLPYSYDEKTNIYNIFHYDKDHLWLACYRRGLQLFNKHTGKIVKHWSHARRTKSNNNISYFDHFPVGKDTLVLASDDGLIIYDMKKNQFTQIDTKHGLPDKLCFNILPIDDKKIALSTSEGGICYIDLKTNKITKPTHNQGNEYLYFRQGGIRSRTGQMIFISQVDGLVVVNSECDPPAPMKIHLTNLNLNGKNITMDALRKANHLLVAPEEHNQIEIDFSTMDIWRKHSVHYSMWLKGADKQWKKMATPTIFLQSLQSGYFELWIKAVDVSDGSQVMIKALALWIEPIWYKSWWFIMLILLLTSIGLYLYFYYRQEERQKLNDAQLKVAVLHSENIQKAYDLEHIQKQLTKVQFEALRAQMNPHFLFNSLNSIENYIVKNDTLAASNYLQTFSKLIRNILDSSRNELIPFNKDIETLKWYMQLEQIRYRNLFGYSIEIDPLIERQNPLIPPLLVQPFIENAIIHGFGPSKEKNLLLTLRAKLEGQFIIYEIDDNGIGRAASQAYNQSHVRKSNGMNITVQRLALHNGDQCMNTDLQIIDKKKDDIALGTLIIVKILIKADT